jgi:hypothetical protein
MTQEGDMMTGEDKMMMDTGKNGITIFAKARQSIIGGFSSPQHGVVERLARECISWKFHRCREFEGGNIS